MCHMNFYKTKEQNMKSKNEKISSTKDLESPSRRNAILTAGVGAVAAVGATGAFSQTNANESVNNKNTLIWTVQHHL